MTRLVTLITEQRGLFFPIREDIMTSPDDPTKPGLFLELFPQPLSRLYLVLLWRINREQNGDAVVLSNVWLREFAKLHEHSLLDYRKYLHDEKIILHKKIGNGRTYLYRAVNSAGQQLTAETDIEAIARLGNPDPERIKKVTRARAITKFLRRSGRSVR